MTGHARRSSPRGAALVIAMLVVAMIATLASATFWLQWRDLEVEDLERQRQQDEQWTAAALDWACQALAEDMRTAPTVDHLGEPWAAGIVADGLAPLLSTEHATAPDAPLLRVSAQITDAQSRLNLLGLLSTRPPGRESGSIGGNGDGDDETAAWTRLAQDLGLSDADLETLVQRWPRLGQSMGRPDDALSSDSAFLPHRVDQLGWIGLSPAGLAALTPHVTLLPTPTPINLNTAGADVLQAVIPGLDAAAARQLLVLRARRPWQSLEEARQALGPLGHQIQPSRHAVTSRYFLIRTRLQRGSLVRQSEALVERGSNSGIQVIWRRTLPSMAAGQGTDGG